MYTEISHRDPVRTEDRPTMRPALKDLSEQSFDVAVIGAGVNGANTAQTLSARGYRVLLVDKGDFASGSSSRSSRLLHCGLRYLAPGGSLWDFVRHPGRFAVACRMARDAMISRARFVELTPERVRPLSFCFPVYDDSPYAGWQIDAAFALLGRLGGRSVPLDYRRLGAREALETPLLEHLRAPDRLKSVAMFREYQFDWPERIAMDAILDAERMGATVRNYTPVTHMARKGDGWRLELADALDDAVPPVSVSARAVCNMAGIWIDDVNGRAEPDGASRLITGTKGCHIVVQLPAECRDYGIATLNRLNEPFYCIPWRGLHYFGPTETLYEGDRDDIHVTPEEIDFLIGEANHLLPGLKVSRSDVLYTWAGVRPLTYDPAQPLGARSRDLHDLSPNGMENVFAMTAGPIMSHRSAGTIAADALAPKLAPSGPAAEPSYAARSVADIRRAVAEEQAETLVDVMFRRTGKGWSETMGREEAEAAAEIMGEVKGWPRERIAREAADYLEYLRHTHTLPA